jgi:hypothetical protein
VWPPGVAEGPNSRAALRRQLALVRALVDELDRLACAGGEQGAQSTGPAFQEQLREDLTRLGCRILEHAAAMTDAPSVAKAPSPPRAGLAPANDQERPLSG